MIEFEGFIVIGSQTLGTKSPILGLSGSVDRNLSSLDLNSSVFTFVRFLIELGRELKRRGPLTCKL